MEYVTNFYMDFHWKNEYVGIFKAEVDGIKYYFIEKCTALYRESESVSSSKKTFSPPAYTEFCRQFFYDEKLPLIRQYGLNDAYNYNKKFFLWYDVCKTLLGNKKNRLTNCFYWLFGGIIFKLLYFKL